MSIGRLRRHLDLDAIARVQAGIRHKPQPVTRQNDPRPARTYRRNKRLTIRKWRAAELATMRSKEATP